MDIQQELKNIENVISLTRASCQNTINTQFAAFQYLPDMYIKEYEDLTSKVHELEAEEKRIMEQLSNGRKSPKDLIEPYFPTQDETSKPLCDTLTRSKFLRPHLPNQ
ncbi:hypothetical protein NQ314_005511 [Rhamnusium bicolor]|uniref:Uncharacterized protein n=1 Tax=Rhamnusium bicolor TaxID=1586634 RepID=A0AAV8ZJ96_9CUCU|nr:hypothetical protein NQ314_005511 [Rhamnusium bicolor]